MAIGREDAIAAGKCGDHGEKSRLRQVEIREELIYDAKRFSRIEKDRGFIFSRNDGRAGECGGFFRRVFKSANDRGADGQNRPSSEASPFNRAGGRFGNFIGLGVDRVVFQALSADRLESAEADFESDFSGFEAASGDALENFRGEVESRGGRGDGVSLPGVNGLIAVAVEGIVVALDVGRQRDVAEIRDGGVEIGWASELEDTEAESAARLDAGFELPFAKNDRLAHRNFAAGADERFPAIAAKGADQKDLDIASEKFAAGGIVRAQRMRAEPFSPAE